MVGWQQRFTAIRCEYAERIAGLCRGRRILDVRPCHLGSRWCAVGAVRLRRLVHSDCTVGADLTGGDTLTAVAEHIAGDKVDPAHDKDDDTSRDHHTPKGKTERLLAHSFFVQVAEHVDAEHDHCKSQSDEAVRCAEQWPIAGVEGTEERELRSQEEHYGLVSADHMLSTVFDLLLVIAVRT